MSEEEIKFIYKLVKKMYGEINPIGETNEDDLRYDNLRKYGFLINMLINDMKNVSKNYDEKPYSLQRSGKCAKEFIIDLKNDLQEFYEDKEWYKKESE